MGVIISRVIIVWCLLTTAILAQQPQPYVLDRAKFADTLAAALAKPALRDGDVLVTKGYTTVGDSGGNQYIHRSSGWSSLTAAQQATTGFYARIGATDKYLEAVDKTVANILQFGAVGDGSTDCYAAIQAAIDSGAERVYVPSGTYVVSQTLEIDCTSGSRTFYLYGDSRDTSIIRKADAMTTNTPLLQAKNQSVSNAVSWSKISDLQLYGASASGARCNYVVDMGYLYHTEFCNVRLLGANRATFLLGYNYSNTFHNVVFQPTALSSDYQLTHGVVVTSAVNNANAFTACTFIECSGWGYLSTSGGLANSFHSCRPEICELGAFFINGGQGWSFEGTYVEATGGNDYPHKFTTKNNTDTALDGGPWSPRGVWVFNGSARQMSADRSTTATATAPTSTVEVASASGLVKGARVEITGAGSGGSTHYTRIASISGTSVTLDDAISTTISGSAFLQPIQASPDVSIAYGTSGVAIHGTGWSESSTTDMVVVAAGRDMSIDIPGLDSDGLTAVRAGTNRILSFPGTIGSAESITVNGNLSGGNLDDSANYVRVNGYNTHNTNAFTLFDSDWPWATRDIAYVDVPAMTHSGFGTWADTGIAIGNQPIWKLTTDGSGATGYVTTDIDLAAFPKLRGKWCIAEIEYAVLADEYANGTWNVGMNFRAESTGGQVSMNNSGYDSQGAFSYTETTGSITGGTATLTVASATGMVVGDFIAVDGAGATGDTLVTTIAGVSGTTITLTDNAISSVTNDEVYLCKTRLAGLTFLSKSDDDAMTVDFNLTANTVAGNCVLVKSVRVRELGSWQYIDHNFAFANDGLTVGVDVQAYDADLTTYAGIPPSANMQTFLGSADYSAMRTNMGVAIGSNVQAYDADLTTYAGITPPAAVQTFLGSASADIQTFVTSPSNLVARAALGVAVGVDVQAYDADLTTYAGIPPSANVQTLLGSANNAAMRTNMGVAIGTDVQAYDANLTTYAGITPSANVQSVLGAADYAAIRALLQYPVVLTYYVTPKDGSTISSGTAKLTTRAPYAFTLTAVRASVTGAPSGSTITADVNETGSSVLSTIITIEDGETTTETALNRPVVSDSAIADDAVLTFDIDGATGGGTELEIKLIGWRTE